MGTVCMLDGLLAMGVLEVGAKSNIHLRHLKEQLGDQGWMCLCPLAVHTSMPVMSHAILWQRCMLYAHVYKEGTDPNRKHGRLLQHDAVPKCVCILVNDTWPFPAMFVPPWKRWTSIIAWYTSKHSLIK